MRLPTPLILAAVLYLAPMRRSRAEERVDFKTLYYQEDDGRVRVIAPGIQFEKELSPTLTIKVDGVYNAISGATPTGAPPLQAYEERTVYITVPAPAPPTVPSAAPAGRDDDDDDEEDREDEDKEREGLRNSHLKGLPAGSQRRPYVAQAGATPRPTPSPSSSRTPAQPPATGTGGGTTTIAVPVRTPSGVPATTVPKQDIEDERIGVNLELAKRLGRHTPAIMLSISEESDYLSQGVAVRDAIDFNEKNTTLTVGVAVNVDQVESLWSAETEDKQTVDGMVGVTQLLDARTYLTCNLTHGHASGYLTDPYKVVEVNGTVVPEKRPDSKDKDVVYLALTRFVETLQGSAEVSYRWYDDTFGITAHTAGLAWYQKLGDRFIVRPAVRYYTQTAADFYAVSFTGDPAYYSADYRVSEFDAIGYGLKFIWSPTDRVSFDLAFEHYGQEGKDGVTLDDAYAQANYILAGVRISL